MRQIYKKSGFSLVEIIIAVLILAFLTILVAVLLDPADFFPSARDTRRISDLQGIDSALSMYRQDVGAFFKTSSISQADPSNAVIGLVRQDCTGYSNCFTSLAAWQAAFGGINFGACAQGDLVCANKVAVARIEGAWSAADTTAVVINGWTTTSTNYIKIYTTQTARHNGKWNNSAYRLESGGTGGGNYWAVIGIKANYVKIDGLQIQLNICCGGTSQGITISDWVSTTNSEVMISNNIIRTLTASLGSYDYGIRMMSGHAVKVFNNIVYGFNNNTSYGIAILGNINNSDMNLYSYNNTVIDSYNGIYNYMFLPTVYAKNNIVQSSTHGYFSNSGNWGSGTGYNISNDDTAPGINSKNSATVSFADSANKDFHLAPIDASARGTGINLSADPNLSFSNDIDGFWRFNIWDIGADQLQDIFISLPDSSNICANSSLPIPPSGWSYRCSASSTLTKTNGTGWIPVDFTKIPGNAFSVLPIDPVNQVESGQYYTFVIDGKKWELTSILESDKNKGVDKIGGKDGGQNVNILEIGSNLTLTPSAVKNR